MNLCGGQWLGRGKRTEFRGKRSEFTTPLKEGCSLSQRVEASFWQVFPAGGCPKGRAGSASRECVGRTNTVGTASMWKTRKDTAWKCILLCTFTCGGISIPCLQLTWLLVVHRTCSGHGMFCWAAGCPGSSWSTCLHRASSARGTRPTSST